MSSPLIVPLALFAAVILLLTLIKATRIRNIEAEIRRRLHQEEKEHWRKMGELEVELGRTKQERLSNMGVLDPQNEQ
jgi:hypothetical protein